MTNDELDAVLTACAEQMVDAEDTGEPEDFVYNRAVTDCMDAIRALQLAAPVTQDQPSDLLRCLRSTSSARSWADADRLMEAAANRIEDLESQLAAPVAAQEPRQLVRYEIDHAWTGAEMREAADGEWVKYEEASQPAQGERQP